MTHRLYHEPVPVILRGAVERQELSVKIAEIDLSAVSDDPSAAFEQLSATDGLLLAGRARR